MFICYLLCVAEHLNSKDQLCHVKCIMYDLKANYAPGQYDSTNKTQGLKVVNIVNILLHYQSTSLDTPSHSLE